MGFLNIFKKNNNKKNEINIDNTNCINEDKEKIDQNKSTYNFVNNENKEIELVKAEILKVVKITGDFKTLREGAEVAKENIGVENIYLLKDFLSETIEQTNDFKDRYKSDTEWKTAVCNATLVIIYTYKENAVNILSEIAYGSTDLNIKAINLLMKLANEGIEQDRIIDDIMNNISYFNDNDKLHILGFMSQIKNNNKVIAITQHFFKEFLKNEDVEGAYEVLVHLINVAGRTTQGHMNFLKALSVEDVNINLEKVMTLNNNDIHCVNIENLNEIVRIKAALMFYNFNNEDKEVNNNLNYWSQNYNNKEVSDEIIRVMSLKA